MFRIYKTKPIIKEKSYNESIHLTFFFFFIAFSIKAPINFRSCYFLTFLNPLRLILFIIYNNFIKYWNNRTLYTVLYIDQTTVLHSNIFLQKINLIGTLFMFNID